MVLTRFPVALKSISPLELALFIVFVIYIVLPIQTPSVLVGYVDSPLGLLTMFIITIYLFTYMNPLLGIIYIFVAYEVISRTSKLRKNEVDVVHKDPVYKDNNQELSYTNESVNMLPMQTTLEEEIVAQMAPTSTIADEIPNVDTFQPNLDKIAGASMFE